MVKTCSWLQCIASYLNQSSWHPINLTFIYRCESPNLLKSSESGKSGQGHFSSNIQIWAKYLEKFPLCSNNMEVTNKKLPLFAIEWSLDGQQHPKLAYYLLQDSRFILLAWTEKKSILLQSQQKVRGKRTSDGVSQPDNLLYW